MAEINAQGGLRMHVYDPNAVGGLPILFLHGWPLCQSVFEYQYLTLCDQRCIGLDLRGFGASGAPAGGYTLQAMSDDVAAVVRRLSLRQFVLVGHSLGAAVAARYMRRYRGNGVVRLALISPVTPPEDTAELIALCKANRPQLCAALCERFLPESTQPDLKRWIYSILLQQGLPGTLGALCGLQQEDWREDIHFVKVPTAILHAKDDRFAPFPQTQALGNAMQNVMIYALETGGHLPFITQKDSFNSIFVPFVKGLL